MQHDVFYYANKYLVTALLAIILGSGSRLWEMWLAKKLLKDGVRVKARIIHLDFRPGRGVGGYVATYEFLDEGGSSFKNSMNAMMMLSEGQTDDTLKIGDMVDVIYQRGKPKTNYPQIWLEKQITNKWYS